MSSSRQFVQGAGAGTTGSEEHSAAKMPSYPEPHSTPYPQTNLHGDLKALVMITLEEQISKVLTGLINDHVVRLESSLRPAVEASLTVIKSEARKIIQTELSDIVLKVHRQDATDQLQTLLQAEMMGIVVQLEDTMRRELRNRRTSPQDASEKSRPTSSVETDPGKQPLGMTFGNRTIAGRRSAPTKTKGSRESLPFFNEMEMDRAGSKEDSELRSHGQGQRDSLSCEQLDMKKADCNTRWEKSVSIDDTSSDGRVSYQGDERQDGGLQSLEHASAAAHLQRSRDQDDWGHLPRLPSLATHPNDDGQKTMGYVLTSSGYTKVPKGKKIMDKVAKPRSRMTAWGGDKERKKASAEKEREKNMQARLDSSSRKSWVEFRSSYTEEDGRPLMRKSVEWLVCCDNFNYMMGGILVLNAFMMGVQADYFAKNGEEASKPFSFGVFDTFFCVIFAAEVGLRLVAFGLKEFAFGDQKKWNWFDTLIVALQIFDEIVKLFLEGSSVQKGMSNVGIIRILRLGKLARLVRMVRLIPELKSMVYLISASIDSFFWSMMLILMMMYVFGIYYTEMVTNLIAEKQGIATEEEIEKLKKYWGNLPVSIFSLWMAITGGDDWRNFVDVLKLDKVYLMHALFFVAYVAFGTLVMLNLVTGVFVEGAQRIVKEDKDNELLVLAATLFKESGLKKGQEITVEEFNDRLNSGAMDEYIEAIGINRLEADHLFEALDRDRSGEISLLEFVQGCLRLRGPARSIDISELGFRMRDYMLVVRNQQTRLGHAVQQMAAEQAESMKDVYKLIKAVEEHVKQVKHTMLAVMGYDGRETHECLEHVPGQLHYTDDVLV